MLFSSPAIGEISNWFLSGLLSLFSLLLLLLLREKMRLEITSRQIIENLLFIIYGFLFFLELSSSSFLFGFFCFSFLDCRVFLGDPIVNWSFLLFLWYNSVNFHFFGEELIAYFFVSFSCRGVSSCNGRSCFGRFVDISNESSGSFIVMIGWSSNFRSTSNFIRSWLFLVELPSRQFETFFFFIFFSLSFNFVDFLLFFL